MAEKRRNGATWGPPDTFERIPVSQGDPTVVASESYDPGYETFNELPEFRITKAQVKDGYVSYGKWTGEAGSDPSR